MTVGRVLSEKYELTEEIARGGMGVVYRARQVSLGRTVAVKLLHSQYAAEDSFVARFEREARAMARLEHEHIIRVYDVAEDGDERYIVMEYFEGRDLKDLIRERGRFPVQQALDVTLQVVEALDYSHRAGVIHRDIKPSNVMLDARGRAKLADFGIAAAVGEATLTLTGQTLGTPEYMSPEQARGDPVDPRSDLYSAGMVLYAMLTGVTPFEGMSTVAIIGQLVARKEELSLAFPADVPAGVRDCVRRLLRKNPQDRFAEAAAAAAGLRALLGRSEGFSERDTESLTSVLRGGGGGSARSILKRWVLLGGVAVLAVVTAYAMLRSREATEQVSRVQQELAASDQRQREVLDRARGDVRTAAGNLRAAREAALEEGAEEGAVDGWAAAQVLERRARELSAAGARLAEEDAVPEAIAALRVAASVYADAVRAYEESQGQAAQARAAAEAARQAAAKAADLRAAEEARQQEAAAAARRAEEERQRRLREQQAAARAAAARQVQAAAAEQRTAATAAELAADEAMANTRAEGAPRWAAGAYEAAAAAFAAAADRLAEGERLLGAGEHRDASRAYRASAEGFREAAGLAERVRAQAAAARAAAQARTEAADDGLAEELQALQATLGELAETVAATKRQAEKADASAKAADAFREAEALERKGMELLRTGKRQARRGELAAAKDSLAEAAEMFRRSAKGFTAAREQALDAR